MSAIDRERWEKMTDEEKYDFACELAVKASSFETVILEQAASSRSLSSYSPEFQRLVEQIVEKVLIKVVR